MMNDEGQQSNRQDMLKAVKERKYETVSFKKGVSGTVFKGNNFLVIWKKGK
jgi:hypothetical protein